MEVKLILIMFAEMLGIKGVAEWVGTIDNVKELIIFIMLMIYAGVRIWLIIRLGLNRIRKEEQELRKNSK